MIMVMGTAQCRRQDSDGKRMALPNRPKLPPWIRVKTHAGCNREAVNDIVSGLELHTVCQSAKCPNLAECWHGKTATFMILGNACTRNCRFCNVGHHILPGAPDSDEPQKVAEAAARLGLRFAVITSVTRDDLPDGGAQHFADTIHALRSRISGIKVEVLTPDFQHDERSLRIIADARPDVFNHNLETVERLTPLIRDRATYRNSLSVLKRMSELMPETPIKSGIMVGLGETDAEVLQTFQDMYTAGVRRLTVGQYLPPSASHWTLDRYVDPSVFEQWRKDAEAMGFTGVASGPLVRSSYHAHRLAENPLSVLCD